MCESKIVQKIQNIELENMIVFVNEGNIGAQGVRGLTNNNSQLQNQRRQVKADKK